MIIVRVIPTRSASTKPRACATPAAPPAATAPAKPAPHGGEHRGHRGKDGVVIDCVLPLVWSDAYQACRLPLGDR
jgi:hypothetical protein